MRKFFQIIFFHRGNGSNLQWSSNKLHWMLKHRENNNCSQKPEFINTMDYKKVTIYSMTSSAFVSSYFQVKRYVHINWIMSTFLKSVIFMETAVLSPWLNKYQVIKLQLISVLEKWLIIKENNEYSTKRMRRR